MTGDPWTPFERALAVLLLVAVILGLAFLIRSAP